MRWSHFFFLDTCPSMPTISYSLSLHASASCHIASRNPEHATSRSFSRASFRSTVGWGFSSFFFLLLPFGNRKWNMVNGTVRWLHHLQRGHMRLVRWRQIRHLELALGARSGGQQTIDAFLLHCAARLALRQNKVTSCYTVPEVWSYKYVYTNRSMNDSGRRWLLVHSSVCNMWKSCPSWNVNSIPPVHVTIFLVKHGDTHTCVSEPAMVMSAAIAGQTLEKNGAFKGKLWNCLAHLRRMSFHALKQDAFLRSYLAPSIGDLVNTYESSNDLHLIYMNEALDPEPPIAPAQTNTQNSAYGRISVSWCKWRSQWRQMRKWDENDTDGLMDWWPLTRESAGWEPSAQKQGSPRH